jgi:hypothetical protein
MLMRRRMLVRPGYSARMLLADIIDQYYRAGPEPGSFIALMVLGFIVGIFGHLIRSRLLVGVGVVMIFLATVILPFQFAGQFQ